MHFRTSLSRGGDGRTRRCSGAVLLARARAGAGPPSRPAPAAGTYRYDCESVTLAPWTGGDYAFIQTFYRSRTGSRNACPSNGYEAAEFAWV